MKCLPILVVSLLMLCTFDCGSKHKSIDSDPLTQYRDTLIGNFNGIDIDTLIAEPIDTTKERAMWDWFIYSNKNSVDTLILTQRFSVKMIQEGDLDGNGTDEFGVRREAESGTWDNYCVYTYDKGQWKYLIEPIWTYSSHFYADLNKGKDVAERTDKTEYIKVRFSDVRNDGEDFLIIDTLIKINPQKIEGFE